MGSHLPAVACIFVFVFVFACILISGQLASLTLECQLSQPFASSCLYFCICICICLYSYIWPTCKSYFGVSVVSDICQQLPVFSYLYLYLPVFLYLANLQVLLWSVSCL